MDYMFSGPCLHTMKVNLSVLCVLSQYRPMAKNQMKMIKHEISVRVTMYKAYQIIE